MKPLHQASSRRSGRGAAAVPNGLVDVVAVVLVAGVVRAFAVCRLELGLIGGSAEAGGFGATLLTHVARVLAAVGVYAARARRPVCQPVARTAARNVAVDLVLVVATVVVVATRAVVRTVAVRRQEVGGGPRVALARVLP
jgi:hypothetical protein